MSAYQSIIQQATCLIFLNTKFEWTLKQKLISMEWKDTDSYFLFFR